MTAIDNFLGKIPALWARAAPKPSTETGNWKLWKNLSKLNAAPKNGCNKHFLQENI
jgi:myosin-crossreactive antigen